jgi:hypothetical protein
MNRILQPLALAALLALPGAAFAGRDDAETALTQAGSAVAAAERAGAETNAAVELKLGRDQLWLADRLCADREWDECENVADRSRADSRLAEARSRQRTNEATTAELEAAVETLRTELARNGD